MINTENDEEDRHLRKTSSQMTILDPFHPAALQQQNQLQHMQEVEDQQQLQQNYVSSRQSSIGESFSRNDELDEYQSFEDQYSPYAHKVRNSEPKVSHSHRVSIRRSSASPDVHVEVLQTLPGHNEIVEVTPPKTVNYKPEEIIKDPKPHITAQQRWLWAYNKIIMQLDVSMFFIMN